VLQTGSGRSVKGAPVRSLPLAASRVGIHPPARTQEAPGGNRGIEAGTTQRSRRDRVADVAFSLPAFPEKNQSSPSLLTQELFSRYSAQT